MNGWFASPNSQAFNTIIKTNLINKSIYQKVLVSDLTQTQEQDQNHMRTLGRTVMTVC